MRKALDVAFRAAHSDATILLLGESGTGKSVWRGRCIDGVAAQKGHLSRSVA